MKARMSAYQILLHLEQRVSYPDRLLRRMLERHPAMDERDRALLSEIVYGVLRWRERLDWHIDHLSSLKPRKIASSVRVLLRTGLYQILFLDRVPPHAAVHETVEIAKNSQPQHIVRFVNGVLREALRRADRWEWPSEDSDPAEFLRVVTSHPKWFVERCLAYWGFEETREICRADNQVAPLSVRINPLRIEKSRVIEWLRTNHFEVRESPYLAGALRLGGIRRDPAQLPIHENGWIQIQDEASQMVSHLVAPRPGERILDLCSGFGGKSTHLAILMEDRGEILAVDQAAWKLEDLRENARRQGIGIIRTLRADALDVRPEETGMFDRVLLDAPCSGLGVVRRKPDIKWRRHPKDPRRFSVLQKALLDHAAKFVRPGGILVYATCTIFPEENEEAAQAFQASHEGWEMLPASEDLPEKCRPMSQGPFFRTWPHLHGVDGFFGARWKRGT